jgi:hypothetical protein
MRKLGASLLPTFIKMKDGKVEGVAEGFEVF